MPLEEDWQRAELARSVTLLDSGGRTRRAVPSLRFGLAARTAPQDESRLKHLSIALVGLPAHLCPEGA